MSDQNPTRDPGYTALVEMGLEKYAFEAVIIRYPNLFSDEAVQHSKQRIENRIAAGCREYLDKPLAFFRADDIGIPSQRFSQLIACFQKHLVFCLQNGFVT